MMRQLLAAAALLAAGALAEAAKLQYGAGQLLVSGSGSAPVSTASTKYPKAAAKELSAAAGQHLTVSFEVRQEGGEAASPHQAFVRLTQRGAGGKETFFVAKPAAGQEHTHSLSLDLSDRASLATAAEAGAYDVDVIVGDAEVSNPVVWRLGSVSLSPAAPPSKPAPVLYSSPLLHESDTTLVPLKEIEHQFRQPEKRPPASVSLTATGMVLAAFLAWLGAALRLPFRWSLPGRSAAWALAFHGSFAALLGLYSWFWLSINMFNLLAYVAPTALAMAISGRQLLLSLQAAREQEADKAAKSS